MMTPLLKRLIFAITLFGQIFLFSGCSSGGGGGSSSSSSASSSATSSSSTSSSNSSGVTSSSSGQPAAFTYSSTLTEVEVQDTRNDRLFSPESIPATGGTITK